MNYLLSVESLNALRINSKNNKNNKEKERAKKLVKGILEKMNLKWKEYSSLPYAKKNKIIETFRYEMFEGKYVLKKDDKRLKHSELIEIIDEFKKNHRLVSKKYPWAYTRHIIDVITILVIDLGGVHVAATILTKIDFVQYWM